MVDEEKDGGFAILFGLLDNSGDLGRIVHGLLVHFDDDIAYAQALLRAENPPSPSNAPWN